jgi:hypothetical protein
VALDPAAVSDYESFKRSVRDPALSAAYFLSKISDEKISTNLLLREINAKLDMIALYAKSTQSGSGQAVSRPFDASSANSPKEETPIIPEIDEEILKFVFGNGRATAQEVADKFGYKGKNAACARLSRLALLGLLSKKQAGRKVYYLPAGE